MIPSIITFYTFHSKEKVKSILKKLNIIKPVTSYGHPFTSIYNFIKTSKYDGKSVCQLRIGIGYNDDLKTSLLAWMTYEIY